MGRIERAANVLTGVAVAVALVTGLIGGLAIAEIRDDRDDDGGAEASDPATSAVVDGDTPSCDELIGRPTQEVLDLAACNDGTTVQALAALTSDCPDGRTLNWNDFGWGYTDGTWQAHARPDGQLIPPDAELAACNT